MKDPQRNEDDYQLHFNPSWILLALAAVGLSLTMWSFFDIAGHATRMAAMQDAALLSEAASALRRAQTQAIQAGPETEQTPLAGPNSLELAGLRRAHKANLPVLERIAANLLGARVQYYSPYPFPGRREGAALPDDFARRAWASLNENPDEPFVEHASRDGQQVLRYAAADRMSKACVSCHNSIANSPIRNWKEGDVQAVIEVSIPLDTALVVDTTTDIRQGLVLFAFLSVLWFSVAGLALLAARKKSRTALAEAERHQKLSRELRQAIGERAQAEHETLQLERQIQHAQKLESLGHVTGGLAHDFNNLLVPIVANASFLESELPPESPGQEMLEDINLAATRAAKLCRQMLAYAGQANIECQSFELNQAIREMFELLETNASDNCKLELALCEDSLFLESDPTQIEQILLNLISNASDAIGDGGGIISIRTGRSTVESNLGDLSPFQRRSTSPEAASKPTQILRAARPGVFIEIADNGKGMSEEEVEKIFDPFYSSKSVGRGLGLAAVHGIVRSHRGSISVDSEIGKFTRVRVAFPVENDALIEQTPPDERRGDDAWTPSGTVLVADDEPGVRSITARMLEEIGFDVVVADDGESATLIFERSPDAFCACLFDVTMPRKDGVQALHDVRSLRPTQPAVLFSGYSEKFSEIREIENGHTSFLEKPFRAAMLREKLEGVLTHSERRAPSAAHGATPPLPQPPDTHSEVAQMVQPAAESDSHETP